MEPKKLVDIYSEDYTLIEYGIGEADMRKVEKNLLKKAKGEKAAAWDGTTESLRH